MTTQFETRTCSQCPEELIMIPTKKSGGTSKAPCELKSVQQRGGEVPEGCFVYDLEGVCYHFSKIPGDKGELYISHWGRCPGTSVFKSRQVGKKKCCSSCGYNYYSEKCPRCT